MMDRGCRRGSAPEARAAVRRAGERPGAGAGAGPRAALGAGFLSFHPDSPSALPADSVLLGDHVTRAAFDPCLGVGRGRGPEGVSAAGPTRYGAAAGSPGDSDPGETKPGGNQDIRGQKGNRAGGRRGCGGNQGDKDPCPPRLQGPWECPGQAKGDSRHRCHWAYDNLPEPCQISAGVTPPGQALRGGCGEGIPPHLCPNSRKSRFSFIVIIWFIYWFHCLLECHLPQQVVPS